MHMKRKRKNSEQLAVSGRIKRRLTANRFLRVFLLLNFLHLASYAQRCAAVQYDSAIAKRYPYWRLKRTMLEDSIQAYLKNASTDRRARQAVLCAQVRIPVVVHVVHNNAAMTIGGRDNGNISDEQILAQIRTLNEDYQRKPGTRGFNSNPVGANTGIEFYLANEDPDGNPTNGITRHYYSAISTFDIFTDDQTLANIVNWPTDRYLNIWVSRFGNNYLGIGQFPSATGVKGLDSANELLEKTDGVFIDYKVFGSGGAVTSKLYSLGRTTTHEVGHWLGLIHTWGDADCGDDYCADTPPAQSGNQSTNCGPLFSTCSGVRTRNMTENYMDYSPDSCMNIFTVNQSERMMAVIEKAPRRARLVKYWCSKVPFGDTFDVKVFPNPASDQVNIQISVTEFTDFEVELYNITGQLVGNQKFTDYPSWLVTFPTTNISPGVYIVRVKTEKETVSKRLVITR